MLEPLSRDTLTKQATETLRRFILTEDLKPNDQLPSERELSESLSVSRNIVREALSVLVAEGLIVKQPGRGIFITDFDRERVAPQIAVSFDYNGRSPAALSEARAAVELGAISLIARRITDAELQQLKAINASLEENRRMRRSTIKDDIEFHKLLLQASRNPVLIELIPLLQEYFRLAVLYRPSAIFHNPERVISEHRRIIQALRERDAAAARARGNRNRVLVSALTGAGTDALIERLDQELSGRREILRLDVDLADGRKLAWLYDKGEVLSRDDRDQTAHLTVALDPPDVARFRRQFPDAGTIH